ncbi:multiple epidermal growth factor-like domains protein 10 [Gigantopelta aegis]|uniref:multiple epidermal growth factor-like domains protein 10 n=1 Tax=Gigantopelta aegis TaxID=1735272 RepID=UPI001B88D628|nr:multiple epidermal growth factor-like domains protein 10 [Gigantopelta aegis]
MASEGDQHKLHRKGVTVYSSVAENQRNTGHLCGSINSTSPDVTWVTCDDTARYITLYRDNNNGYTPMDFCEVQVFVCNAGTFGHDCSQFCHCEDGTCNYVTGECTGGCKSNWTGRTCSECSKSTYGFWCANNCNQRNCLGNSSCDHVTGKCDQGCDRGYQGEDCATDAYINWESTHNLQNSKLEYLLSSTVRSYHVNKA